MSKTIEEIIEDYTKGRISGVADFNEMIDKSLLQPIEHVKNIAERYVTVKTQELQEQNAELAKELAHVVKALKTVSSFGATTPIIEHAEGILTKHNHLKSNTNE